MASRNRVGPIVTAIVGLAILVALAPYLARHRGVPAVALAKIQKMSFTRQKSPVSNMKHSVWVNRRSGLYYCRSSKFYRRIWPGEYMQQGIALERGFRPAEGKTCP